MLIPEFSLEIKVVFVEEVVIVDHIKDYAWKSDRFHETSNTVRQLETVISTSSTHSFRRGHVITDAATVVMNLEAFHMCINVKVSLFTKVAKPVMLIKFDLVNDCTFD